MKGKSRALFGYSQCLAFLLAMCLGLLCCSGVAIAADTTTVSISAPTQPVGPGEQFTVSVVVAPSTAIAGVQFDLDFDASLAAAGLVQEGNLLNQDGASTFFNSGNIDNEAGKITGVFGAITSPGDAVTAQGTFATITFTAKTQSGGCPLDLTNVVVGDIDGDSVPVSLAGGTTTIDRPPVLNAIGNKSVNEGATLSFAISASDPDGDALFYSASNLPPGASFSPATRTFSWTPAYDQAGVYANIRFQVSDGMTTDSEYIAVTVGNVIRPDVNGDGFVNVLDMIRIGQHWDETGASGWIREDINEDGTINVLDATLIGQNWTG